MHTNPSPVGTTQNADETKFCAVPGGLVIHYNSFPGLTSWAKVVPRFALRIERTDAVLRLNQHFRWKRRAFSPATQGETKFGALAPAADSGAKARNNRDALVRWAKAQRFHQMLTASC